MPVHRFPWRFRRFGREDGFTQVEVLVALAVLGALSLLVWASSSAAGRTLQRVSRGTAQNAELLRLDSVLRVQAARILTPYWLPRPKTNRATAGLSLFFLDGDESSCLTLSYEQGVLRIMDGKTESRFPGIHEARMEVVPANGACPDSLVVAVQLDGREKVTFVAQLGGVPLPASTR